MNEKKLHESVNKTLDDELNNIDANTLQELRAIRRKVIASVANGTASNSNVNLQHDVATLSTSPLWRNRRFMFMGLAFVICVTWALMQGATQKNTSQDISLDFVLYSEIDPDWLMDMEIADTFGDE